MAIHVLGLQFNFNTSQESIKINQFLAENHQTFTNLKVPRLRRKGKWIKFYFGKLPCTLKSLKLSYYEIKFDFSSSCNVLNHSKGYKMRFTAIISFHFARHWPVLDWLIWKNFGFLEKWQKNWPPYISKTNSIWYIGTKKLKLIWPCSSNTFFYLEIQTNG